MVVPLETMIEFETTWQCDVTRYSFGDTDAIAAKEQELRDRFGVGADDQAMFVSLLATDGDLRARLADQIDERCQATAPTDGNT